MAFYGYGDQGWIMKSQCAQMMFWVRLKLYPELAKLPTNKQNFVEMSLKIFQTLRKYLLAGDNKKSLLIELYNLADYEELKSHKDRL